MLVLNTPSGLETKIRKDLWRTLKVTMGIYIGQTWNLADSAIVALNLLPLGLARFNKKVQYDKHGRSGSKYRFCTSLEVKEKTRINYKDHSAICKHGSDKVYIRIGCNTVVSRISLLKIVFISCNDTCVIVTRRGSFTAHPCTVLRRTA